MFKFIKNLFSASPKVREKKHSSEIERYKEDSSGLYRFIKIDKWVDIHDPKRETTLRLETISVHENIDFDEASSKSLSFTADVNTTSKGVHYTAKNKSDGTQTGVSVRKYEDGSVRTESSRYPKVYNVKTDLGEKAFQDMMLRHHESMKDKVDSQEYTFLEQKDKDITELLKEKGMNAVRSTCRFNIKLNTKTLISVANRIDKKMMSSGGNFDKDDTTEIMKAAQSLFTDIRLGVLNDISLEEIEFSIIRPILAEGTMGLFTKQVMEDAIINIKKELGSVKKI